jgi:FkbM family methyltransferase
MGTREALGRGAGQGAGDGPAPVRKRLRVAGTPLEFTIFLEPPGEARDPVSAHLADQDELTLANALLMLRFLKPGHFVLDLGAHLGSLALVAAAAGCHVAAVDASPRNVALLARSQQANGFARLRVVHRAVSDRPGAVAFRPHGAYGQVEEVLGRRPKAGGLRGLLSRAWALLRGRRQRFASAGHEGAAPRVEVAADPVDDLLRELGWPRIDFVKMDIEGFEVRALAGMRGLLSRPDAPPLLYECNGHALAQYGETAQGLKRALEALGYRSYALEPGEWLIPAPAGQIQPICCIDCLAVKGPLPDLGAWKVAAPLDERGLAIRAGWACGDASVYARRYTARLLQTAPPGLLVQPEVRQGIARLCGDDDAEVRAEAARIPLLKAAAA